ncbi:unnamed protein product [Medioppia subpectinata]|uniref:P-type ATPase C-terminal domain-containing protein n=1 Tax=Medioppia subpectinata TaxID=1979941 RepID=A0A7R9L2R8_9ACAR|nr:unnamed protein product [Medioppia subpectinata]CAG2113318.1 unnamed protein product [Medioppia subpectinata]
MHSLGTIVFSATILEHLVHVAIEFRSWSILHLLAISFSIVSYFSFAYIYNYLTLGGMFTSDAFMVIQNVMSRGIFWITLLYILILAPMPRLILRVFQTSLTPSPITQAVRINKEVMEKEVKEEFLNNAPNKKPSISAVWTKKTSSAIMTNTADVNKQVDLQPKLDSNK